jgi:hypothetical protein
LYPEYLMMALAGLGGVAAGVVLTLVLLRFWGVARRAGQETATLHFPCRGKLEVRFDPQPHGLHLQEALEVQEKIRRLSELVDFDWLKVYAQKYRINYIGFKGREAGDWNPGCLACSTLDWSPRAGYRVYLNPELNLEETAARLSSELSLDLKPEEVQTFLFLHEIGHTRQAGNVCLISAAINSALSGGRRTHRRRKELRKLREEVEKYADDFAVRELLKWRVSCQGGRPSPGQTGLNRQFSGSGDL